MVIIYFQKKKNMAVIQKEYERQTMQKQLLTDPLTHINNRLALLNVFQEMNQSIKSSHYYLAMIDLDFFKKVNDSLGHVKGDECLQEIGKICILFEEISLEEVLQICDTLRQQISETFIKNFDLHLTISIGIAKYTTDMFAEDLLQNADTALINETISCCMLNKGTSF
jgi:diguanylate cyclase